MWVAGKLILIMLGSKAVNDCDMRDIFILNGLLVVRHWRPLETNLPCCRNVIQVKVMLSAVLTTVVLVV